MSEEGASFKEQILDASRRNNTELIDEIISNAPADKLLHVLNESRDSLGNTPLHLTAKYGSYEVMDKLLDQEGLELDPINNIDGDTPLHLAVRYSEHEPEHGTFISEELIEAGADARLQNKNGLKPLELVQTSNDALQELLQSAEYAKSLEEEEAKRSEFELRQAVGKKLTISLGPEEQVDELVDEGSASESDDE
ncbi:hypothetical protein WICMUC_000980 [Wickerhamomyces mucosus]|uniref:Ankyrin repeat-containing protein n=1 Tax=Wickerhamomyces mucosus TaxID=1378264 RepID=A0A9P8PXJ7_9ASCO|nr:hypothetical protein WICMUC_000980 [Wickerhamomyces mucosus]